MIIAAVLPFENQEREHMINQNVKRKLTAILSADVKGYSRLMGEDEIGTIRTLTAYREAMTDLVLLHRGRVVDAPGDNMLAEFASVVDAVQCAVEIQRELAERNAELPEEHKMKFRMGVNLGDVVEEENRIYGDGVNIAARLESICDAGGVCISGAAFEQVDNKLELEFEDLGKHKVKNITRLVHVYKVLMVPDSDKSIIEEPLELPDKPSIAVLPFVNMSSDLKDIFALQDEITMKILIALQMKLTEGEQTRLYGKGTDNLEAYLKHLQGHQYARLFNKESSDLARQMFEEAIDLDRGYAMAYIYLAIIHVLDVWLGSSKSPGDSLAWATELVQKSMSIDEFLPEAHGVMGLIYLTQRQHDKAIAEVELAVIGNPNSADDLARLGMALFFAGKPKEATASLKKAIRLNPIPPSWYSATLGWVYGITDLYEDAIAAFKKALQHSPDNLFAWQGLAVTYSLSGHETEARAAGKNVLRIEPKFTLEHLGETLPFKSKTDTELVIVALQNAGLK
jgi:class 3 adenylate cyclase/Tfp pilus assembly protein PilF